MTTIPISAVILAGGRGARMGGIDKGWALFAGRPLIEWVLAALAPQVASVQICANRSLQLYQQLAPTFSDSRPDFPGPLAGIEAGLAQSQGEWLLFVPCDTPHLPDDLVKRLWAATAPEVEIVIADDGERVHPTIALIRRRLLADISLYLDQGERKVLRWMERHHYRSVDFSDQPEAFLNVNQ